MPRISISGQADTYGQHTHFISRWLGVSFFNHTKCIGATTVSDDCACVVYDPFFLAGARGSAVQPASEVDRALASPQPTTSAKALILAQTLKQFHSARGFAAGSKLLTKGNRAALDRALPNLIWCPSAHARIEVRKQTGVSA
jgi:hypothetical protein